MKYVKLILIVVSLPNVVKKGKLIRLLLVLFVLVAIAINLFI